MQRGQDEPPGARNRTTDGSARSVLDEEMVSIFPTYMFCQLWDSRTVRVSSRLISPE